MFSSTKINVASIKEFRRLFFSFDYSLLFCYNLVGVTAGTNFLLLLLTIFLKEKELELLHNKSVRRYCILAYVVNVFICIKN